MPRRKYTRDQIAEAVRQSTSVVQVLRHLGVKYRSGEAWRLVRSYIAEYKLDTTHFKGHGQNKGKPSIRRKTPDQVLVVLDGVYRENGRILRRALLELGVQHTCLECGQSPMWRGKPLVLQVDHQNGDWKDCRRENLRFLCPNCHSQTESFGTRGMARLEKRSA